MLTLNFGLYREMKWWWVLLVYYDSHLAEEHLTQVSVQFLEQRYGFFHCKKCNIRWESAYVWCISGTSKVLANSYKSVCLKLSEYVTRLIYLCQVYYKQLCRKCQVGFNPYRVESILCKVHHTTYSEKFILKCLLKLPS